MASNYPAHLVINLQPCNTTVNTEYYHDAMQLEQVLNRTEMVPRGPSFEIGSAHAQKRPRKPQNPPASPAIALA